MEIPCSADKERMCGIVGYIGEREAVPVIVDGLRRLEYRGYDSAGVAVLSRSRSLEIRRASGKLKNLEETIRTSPLSGQYGIGHTRWATHGRPTEENAHPHRDCTGRVMLVHNGIVENYLALRRQLVSEGHVFKTETDSEVIAHLVEKYLDESETLEQAVRQAIRELHGVFAVSVICSSDPDKIVAARSGPPVVIGLGDREHFIASDVPAILNQTRDMFFLEDGDVAVLTANNVRLMDADGNTVHRPISRITWDPVMAEKNGFKHFMLKEIFEQPRAIKETLLGRIDPVSGRVRLDEVAIAEAEFREFKQIKIVACGTSWHAALAGKYIIERLAKIPVEVDYGSEFRYREPIIQPGTLTVVISQSGETADTLAAQKEAKINGSKSLAICNVVGSIITREAAGTLLTHAGPEIGVASTKAFTSQVAALLVLGMYLGQVRGTLTPEQTSDLIAELALIPGKLEQVLANVEPYAALVRQLHRASNFLYLGRGIHFPIALEGALKLKEISYIHAEGYPAGEMKHGPNALIDETLPVVVLATRDRLSPESNILYEKTMSNIQEVKARGGIVVAVACEGDDEVVGVADYVLRIPTTRELLLPLLETIPLQLIAYYMAVHLGCDVDQPRNLAKSVTVE